MSYLRVAHLETKLSLFDKLARINWLLLFLLACLAGVGVTMLYSASGGEWQPFALRHAVRFGLATFVLLTLALIDIRFWMSIAYPAYAIALVLLILVEVSGSTAMGAQRWLDIGPIRVQPSEIMKLTLVMALARYFHGVGDVRRWRDLILPLLLIGVPFLLIRQQPDLGTALLVAATGLGMLFLAGLRWRIIIAGLVLITVAVPVYVKFGMTDYQWRRVDTFLNPEKDPFGSGYQILQSKIALGSGGVNGKGWLKGSQSNLDFLPEKQTDFIFTMIGEEFGFLGALVVLLLYFLVLATGFYIAVTSRHTFGRMLATGVSITFGLYVIVNVGMISGLMPVVGVPLPLVSHGGTVMLAVMTGFGLVMNASVHRDAELPASNTLFL